MRADQIVRVVKAARLAALLAPRARAAKLREATQALVSARAGTDVKLALVGVIVSADRIVTRRQGQAWWTAAWTTLSMLVAANMTMLANAAIPWWRASVLVGVAGLLVGSLLALSGYLAITTRRLACQAALDGVSTAYRCSVDGAGRQHTRQIDRVNKI